MPHIQVDGEELRDFKRLLNEFQIELTIQAGHLKNRFNQLGETWRDQEFERFAESMGGSLRQLESVLYATSEQVTFLGQKIEAIELYEKAGRDDI
jgi:hypothetical protein